MDFEELVKEIESYESDTFSASGEEITHQEAQEVAKRFVKIWFDNHIDGLMIGEVLEKIRPPQEDEEEG